MNQPSMNQPAIYQLSMTLHMVLVSRDPQRFSTQLPQSLVDILLALLSSKLPPLVAATTTGQLLQFTEATLVAIMATHLSHLPFLFLLPMEAKEPIPVATMVATNLSNLPLILTGAMVATLLPLP